MNKIFYIFLYERDKKWVAVFSESWHSSVSPLKLMIFLDSSIKYLSQEMRIIANLQP